MTDDKDNKVVRLPIPTPRPEQDAESHASADTERNNRVDHPSFTTDFVYEDLHGGSFMLLRDGRISHSGGNDFHDVSRRASLIDTGQTKPGRFWAFEMNHPDLDSEERYRMTGRHGVEFELPCRVYRYEGDAP